MSCETSFCITEKVGDSPVAERALQQQEYLLTDFVVATQGHSRLVLLEVMGPRPAAERHQL